MGSFIKMKLSIVCLEAVNIYIGAGLRSAVRKRVERFQGKLVKVFPCEMAFGIPRNS